MLRGGYASRGVDLLGVRGLGGSGAQHGDGDICELAWAIGSWEALREALLCMLGGLEAWSLGVLGVLGDVALATVIGCVWLGEAIARRAKAETSKA
jgi:hypothetical protein